MPTAVAPEDVAQLWAEFKNGPPNQELRNRLVEIYLPLVKYNGERIWARLPEGESRFGAHSRSPRLEAGPDFETRRSFPARQPQFLALACRSEDTGREARFARRIRRAGDRDRRSGRLRGPCP